MASKKYHYIIVFTNGGAVFVTSISSSKEKYAQWDCLKKPLTMGESVADDIALGLRCNGFMAFHLTNNYELDHQLYNYDKIEFKIVRKDENNGDDNKGNN